MGGKNCCQGLLATVSRPTTTVPLCSKHSGWEQGCRRATGRNTHSAKQESNLSGSSFGSEQRLVVVPEKGGGLCPVLDLRVLNKYLRTYKFKMLTLTQVLTTVSLGDLFATIDLTDAYFHIPRTAIQSVACPTHLYKSCRGGDSSSPGERGLHLSLSGRLGSGGEHQRASRSTAVASSVTHSSPSLFGKFTEKCINSESAILLSLTRNMLRFRPSTSFRAQSAHILLLPRSISVGMQTAFSDGFTAVGPDDTTSTCRF